MGRKGMTIIALACGSVCALSVLAYAHSVDASAQAARDEALARYGGDQAQVCVAVRDIAPGEIVSTANVEVRPWLVDLLPDDAVIDFDEIEGEQVASPITSGEVVVSNRLGGDTTDFEVPMGLEAVSVQVDSSQAIGGAIKAGASVNVYATGSDGAAAKVCAAQVLASGSSSSARMWIALAVEPVHVQELIAASKDASLYFVLPSTSEGKAAS